MKLIGVLVFIFLGVSAYGEPTCQDLKDPWYNHYISDFKVKWNTDTFDCGLEDVVALTFYDLETIRFNPNVNGYMPDFYSMVKNPIKGMWLDRNCQALAYTLYKTGSMVLCPAFFQDDREDRVSTLVHESRHMQTDDPKHVTCVGGKYDGIEGACDEKFYDGTMAGSGYNMDIFYMSWVKNLSQPNELKKDVLQLYMNDIIPDRFNTIAAEEIKKWRE